jgi:hypothetical protein
MGSNFSQRFFIWTIYSQIPYGLVVRIPASHAGGPGSIPGVGDLFLFIFLVLLHVNTPKDLAKNSSTDWFFNLD